MAGTSYQLDFEQPLHELEEKLTSLESGDQDAPGVRENIREARKELLDRTRDIYANLDEWQTVRVARHPDRPMFTDYVDLVFDEFVELHGDKFFGDDRALRTGLCQNW